MTSEGAVGPDTVLAFWRAAGPDAWFEKDDAFDAEIRARFLATYEAAAAGRLTWDKTPDGALALLIVLDQFPRNMFRGTARSFASDSLALTAARGTIARGFDRLLSPVERRFIHLPFEHAEDLAAQRRSLALCHALDPEDMQYAKRHYEIIARFGRFPHRNAALGRQSTAEEIEFLKQPGSSF